METILNLKKDTLKQVKDTKRMRGKRVKGVAADLKIKIVH